MNNDTELHKVFDLIKEIDFRGGKMICPPHLKASVKVSEGTESDSFLYKIEVEDNKGHGKIVEIKIFR